MRHRNEKSPREPHTQLDDSNTVIHSSTSDPTPNREAQEAYADENIEDLEAHSSSEPMGSSNIYPFIESERMRQTNEPKEGDERDAEAENLSDMYAKNRGNPTDASPAKGIEDLDDFDQQQEAAEGAGPATAEGALPKSRRHRFSANG